VFTEGKVTEPTYLADWGRQLRDRVLLTLDPRTGRDPRSMVEMAVEAKRSEEKEARKGRGAAHDEYWCVFDLDEHLRIHEAIELAREHGVNLAISNPNFELWIILHHRDQTAEVSKDDTRRAVRDEFGIEKALTPEFVADLNERYPQAAERAEQLDRMHERNGTEGNPSTGLPQLIEALRHSDGD
jgi:RloB-like protein